jgi:hypothetical protein
MISLSTISILVGALTVAARLPGVLAPAKYREYAVRFPRAILPGRILMGIAAAIAWWVMYHAATDEWKWAQPWILIGTPVVYWLVIQYGTSYLSVRAVAALMLMVAKVMVTAADASDTPWRLVVTVFGYLWVIAAIWMTVAPHHLRDAIGFFMTNDQRCRGICAAGVAVGVTLIGLGIFVY